MSVLYGYNENLDGKILPRKKGNFEYHEEVIAVELNSGADQQVISKLEDALSADFLEINKNNLAIFKAR
ncbi:hypothetical protein MTF66_19820 [Pseudoalteromonas sp. 2CM39R]|uniref:hypothetical protein n=1 Tax=Pseudoalteromonas sp. 2CM39R TaxID=2929856 RepID=UPI0020BFB6F2|nr:hypothetical protein [Pseudoalteromonas sp. 2CM39R]MCK8127271.1 hypothetical protein [Pseudoalteromonas sp. 2CM39R]